MNPRRDYWWPLDLSAELESAVERFRSQMLATGAAPIDPEVARRADMSLRGAMADHVESILERDSLPHLAHIVNGWGDGMIGQRRLLDRLGMFVQRGLAAEPMILQCDPEGDFHPWQTFAYAVMAGVDPGRLIPTAQTTLESVAAASRRLQTSDPAELGHLLYALPHLPAAITQPFALQDGLVDLDELVERAIDAHLYGSFRVCRKFHLTEGLCAMSALVAKFRDRCDVSQGFLDGQLEMLLLLGIVIREAGGQESDDSILSEARLALGLGPEFENHCYYAGHLMELAALAASFGFHVAPEYWAVMSFIANQLNKWLPPVLPHTSFPDCFLHVGHYRRGLTLLMRGQAKSSRHLTSDDRAAFTVDFDATSRNDWRALAGDLKNIGRFTVAPPINESRPRFEAVVAAYSKIARAGLEPRGALAHFRRVSPVSWPRSVHYELLDDGEQIGAEIHLESDDARKLAPAVRGLEGMVRSLIPGRPVEWDGHWYRGRGRLRVLFPGDAAPQVIAGGLQTLINGTFSILDPLAETLCLERPGEGLPASEVM